LRAGRAGAQAVGTVRQRPYIILFGAAVRPGGRPSGVLRRRIEGAYSAWRLMPDAALLLTGGVGRHGPAEALVMRERLLAKGVPEPAMILEPTARDTLESALACAAILRARGDAGRVWVCTSAFHAPRCRLLMRLLGFRAGHVRIPPGHHAGPSLKLLLWTLKEFVALPWDALLVLLHRAGLLP
jgi:uncharacterized SAM-binding protein YcdF (DUF218 family)